jgi:FKBP-type peptidyl-prolyl cis-trans isomerase SlyD
MKRIKPDMMVTIDYAMMTQLADGAMEEHPRQRMAFIFGVERQIPSLEKALEGRLVGESFHVMIPDAEIYGAHDPTLIRQIPRKGLVRQRLKEGCFYRQMKKGTLVSFKVLEIRDDSVLADFNKPMAGIGASLDVEIIAAREARKEEIDAAMQMQRNRSMECT